MRYLALKKVQMKKKKVITIAMGTLAVAMIAGYNVYNSRNNINFSDLALANIEALAETPQEYTERTGCVAVTEDMKCVDFNGSKHSYSTNRE